MGTNILEFGDVFARRIGAGTALGFDSPTPAIAISTRLRGRNEDQIVLTLEEARKVAEAILSHLAEE